MREVRSSSFDHPGFLAPLAIAIAGVAFGCSGATGDANLGGGNYDSAPRVDASDDGSDDATLRDTGADTSVKADGGSDSTITDGAGGDAKTDGTASDGGDAIADGTTDGGGDALGDGAIDGGGLDASADGEGGAACGAPGDVCCAGGTCAGGALCVSGKCGTCGGPGLVCCSGTPSCSTGSVCSGGACVKCGGLGEKCCSGSACSTGFVCNTTLDTCARCGGIGEPCCAGGACSTGGVCDGTTLRCACGGPGQPCCAGGTCTGSALCTTAGTCSSCGGVGQPCCAGGGCLGLNVCDTGTCKAPSGCTKESDCTGTGKCGGPSTCAGSVCFVCYTPPASATSSGRAACTDSSTCASNLCDELRGHCSAPCSNTTASRDTDCTSYLGAGYVCTEETLTIGTATGPLGYCVKSCAHDADCPGEVCQASANSGANRIDITCGPTPTGSKAFGVDCDPAVGGCATGVCLTYTIGAITSHKCTAFCTGAGDCGGSLAACSSVSFTRPGGGTQAATVCTP